MSFLSIILMGCGNGNGQKSDGSVDDEGPTLESLYAKGDEVTVKTQAVLLANVANAINEGGPEHAVSYCNVKASGLADSISTAEGVAISRMSNRNRNPENRITTETDKRAWNYWTGKPAGAGAADTVLYDRANAPYYYKPIYLGMETCLQCHGSRSTEISLATLNVLDSLYPGDKAVNYRMGDLRGMWKVEL